MSFSVLAPAKLNLFLNVVGRREDGYHLLDSLFVFTELADKINGKRSTAPELNISGEFGRIISAEPDNLVQSACALMREQAGRRDHFSLMLEKNIPVAAGLGGGSADAAAVLRALNQHWSLACPTVDLEKLAAKLGADVPASIRSRPVVARGIGDQLSAAPTMPTCGILLANPRVPTPTPAVFKAFRDLNPVIAARSFQPLPSSFKNLDALIKAIAPRGNDLLEASIKVTPAIRNVLDVLRSLGKVAFAGLSGSGATCFALFETVEYAAVARDHLERLQPNWWLWSGSWSEGF